MRSTAERDRVRSPAIRGTTATMASACRLQLDLIHMLSAPTHTTAEPQIQSSVHQAHCVLEEHVTTSPPEILSTLARPQIFTLEHSVWSRRSSQSILTPTPAHVSAMDCLSL